VLGAIIGPVISMVVRRRCKRRANLRCADKRRVEILFVVAAIVIFSPKPHGNNGSGRSAFPGWEEESRRAAVPASPRPMALPVSSPHP